MARVYLTNKGAYVASFQLSTLWNIRDGIATTKGEFGYVGGQTLRVNQTKYIDIPEPTGDQVSIDDLQCYIYVEGNDSTDNPDGLTWNEDVDPNKGAHFAIGGTICNPTIKTI